MCWLRRFLFVKGQAFRQHLQWSGGILLLAIFVLFVCAPVSALQLDDLDPDKEWTTAAVEISGNTRFSSSELRNEMVTTTRAWYAPWRSRPRFDPVAFKTDIERLQRFYRAQGYYEAQVSYALQV